MQDSASLALLVTGKDAEISMLRQQLAQLSSDLSRNLAVLSAKGAEAEDAGNAVASLTAVLAEKDELFAQYEEQVAALEALRQKEAAECKQLQAALASQEREWQQQLQTEQSKREKLQQQLEQLEESNTTQLQSARQAAVTQAVQHSSQHKAGLERAAAQQKQLQQQLQQLQEALAAKEAELASVQMQLAAALESTRRVQESHGKSMASKTALVADMQQQLEAAKAGYTRANRAHEAHMGQLISSINEMQELTSKQAAELQQYVAGQKAQQHELQALQQTAKRHEEARSKAEMRKCAMEAALQQEVTAHAAAKAHHGLLQDCVASLLIDVQEQHSRASAAVAQLSAQLFEAQEQMVCVAVSQQPSPQRAQAARALEERCQCLSADVWAAQERTACLAALCTQLSQQVAPLLAAESLAKQPAGAPASPAKAAPTLSPPRLNSCMAALTQSLQQQQKQFQQQQQPLTWQQHQEVAAVQACCTHSATGAGAACPLAPTASPARPQHAWQQAHPSGHLTQSVGAVACEGGAEAFAAAGPAVVGQQRNYEYSPPRQQLQRQLQACAVGQAALAEAGRLQDPHSPAKVCQQWQGWAPGGLAAAAMPPSPPHPSSQLPAADGASMQPLSSLVGQLQAGVARLQQQLGASQQQLTQRVQPTPGALPSPHRSRARPFHSGPCSMQGCQQDQQGTIHHPLQQQVMQQGAHTGSRPLHQQAHREYTCKEPHAAPASLPLDGATAERQYTSRGQHHHHPEEGGQVPDLADSTCGSEDSRSTLSCSTEVAAAVAAARQRLQQQGSPAAWDASGAVGSRARGRAVGKVPASPPGAAALAALASSTLRKLELLSTESPAWC